MSLLHNVWDGKPTPTLPCPSPGSQEQRKHYTLLVGHLYFESFSLESRGFPVGVSGKEPDCQCRKHKRCGLDPWVGKMPWRRAGQPTPVLLPGEPPLTEEPGGLQSMGSHRVGQDRSDLAAAALESKESDLGSTDGTGKLFLNKTDRK